MTTKQPQPLAALPEIHLRLLSQPRLLCGVRGMVTACTKRLGFSDSESSQIALAVDEALCNIVKHGYEMRPDGVIDFRLWVQAPGSASDASPARPSVRIVIEDSAQQVHPQQIKGRDLCDIRPGGLGVHIIHEVMDDAVYERIPGAGMRLTMEKSATEPAKGSGDADCGQCAPKADEQPKA